MYNRFLTSSSESSSDEEANNRRVRVFFPRRDIMAEFNNAEFKMRFRLDKGTVEEILNLIGGNLEYVSDKNNPVTPHNQLLIALRFYATGAFHISTGDTFDISKATVCRIVAKVSHQIAMLRGRFVKMPQGEEHIRKLQQQFYNICEFPRVLGAIDCTHIKIQSPGGNLAELYRNRKGWFSINTQAVCDAQLRFMDIVARWPGSSHDATIFNDSLLRARLENYEFAGSFLLGDSGYGCKPYLLTPLLNPQTNAENAYNRCHIRTRNVIERAFGVLKRRFPCLSLGMRLKLDRVLVVIIATTVLHNIAIEVGDEEPEVEENIEVPRLNDPGIALQQIENDNGAVRRAVIETIFMRR